MELPPIYIKRGLNQDAYKETILCLIHLYGYKINPALGPCGSKYYMYRIYLDPHNKNLLRENTMVYDDKAIEGLIGYSTKEFLKLYGGIGMTRIK